jgi:hypothetical protein
MGASKESQNPGGFALQSRRGHAFMVRVACTPRAVKGKRIMTTSTMSTTKAKKSKAATSTSPTKPMSRTKPNKTANSRKATKNATRANDTPTRRAKKAPKLSAMKAAVHVLAGAPEEGMRTKDMVEAMKEQGLWASPAGKTPEATLYAGITREITKKGDAARFRKVSKGRFILN